MVPLVVLLTDQGLIITQRVAWVTAEGHCGPDAKVTAVPMPIHGDPRIKAGVGLQSHTWTQRKTIIWGPYWVMEKIVSICAIIHTKYS